MVSHWGNDNPAFRAVSSKMLTTFIMTMRGTPYYYNGDEIGMKNIRFDKIETTATSLRSINIRRSKQGRRPESIPARDSNRHPATTAAPPFNGIVPPTPASLPVRPGSKSTRIMPPLMPPPRKTTLNPFSIISGAPSSCARTILYSSMVSMPCWIKTTPTYMPTPGKATGKKCSSC
jgi:hypothetical protein